MTAPAPRLPDWPALMATDLAALYFGDISPETFQLIMAQRGVRPVDIGVRRIRWRRADLDRLIESLPLRGQGAAAGAVPAVAQILPIAADPDAALARVRARARR